LDCDTDKSKYADGPADATATLWSLALVKSRTVYLFGAALPRLSWKKAMKRMSVCVFAVEG